MYSVVQMKGQVSNVIEPTTLTNKENLSTVMMIYIS